MKPNKNSTHNTILKHEWHYINLRAHSIRIVCGLLYFIGICISFETYSNFEHFIVAISPGLFYLLYSLIVILWQKRSYTQSSQSPQYVSLLVDYVIFLSILVIRAYFEVEVLSDLPLYILKNPIFSILYILLLLPLIYLQPGLILFSAGLYSLTFVTLYILVIVLTPEHITTVWQEHTFGDKASLAFLFLHGLIGIALSSVSYFSIRLFNSLVRKINVEQTQKNRLKQYFSPNIATQLMGEGTSKILDKGLRVQLVIMFIDIKDSTLLTEKFTPEELNSYISNFRNIACSSIFDYSGTIYKFIGDAILAVFGDLSPAVSQTQYVQTICHQAMNAAIDIYHKIQADNESEINPVPLQIRMGIDMGENFIGNITSNFQKEYTVIGRSVNIANRLQGLCKRYLASCIVSDHFYKVIRKSTPSKDTIENTTIRGIQEPMTVHVML